MKYLNLANEFVSKSTPPVELTVSPRLLLIYFGLCAIALGSVIFSVWCPNEVKHYGTSAAYVGGDGGNIGDFALEPIEALLRKSPKYKSAYARIRSRYKPMELSQDYGYDQRRQDDAEAKAEIRNGVLHLYFDFLNDSNLFLRLLCAALFFIGFTALAIPSVQVFLRVVQLMVSTFYRSS